MSGAGADLALAARVVLAGTLLAAAIAKWRSGHAADAQFRALLPRAVAVPVARSLPFVETAVAAALVLWVRSAVPAWCAVALVGAFTVVIVRALAAHVPCPCFGAASASRPAGTMSVVRNGVLLAVAVLATGSITGATAPGVIVATVALGVPVAALVARPA